MTTSINKIRENVLFWRNIMRFYKNPGCNFLFHHWFLDKTITFFNKKDNDTWRQERVPNLPKRRWSVWKENLKFLRWKQNSSGYLVGIYKYGYRKWNYIVIPEKKLILFSGIIINGFMYPFFFSFSDIIWINLPWWITI